jgi:hypothetical protein
VGFAADDYLAEWRKFSTMLGAVGLVYFADLCFGMGD